MVTNKGVIAVLQGCPKLKSLELVATRRIGNKTFQYILENKTALCRVRLHKLKLNRRVFRLLCDKIDNVEAHECNFLCYYDRDSSNEESGADSSEETGVDSAEESGVNSGEESGVDSDEEFGGDF